MVLRKVGVGGKRVRFGGIHQQHRLAAAPDILEDGQGQWPLRQRLPGMPGNLHRLLRDPGLGRQRQLVAPGQQQAAALRAGVFEHQAQEGVDQFVELDLAGDGLRRLGHRQQVEPALAFDRHRRRALATRAQLRVLLFELPHLACRAPLGIAGARLFQMSMASGRKAV